MESNQKYFPEFGYKRGRKWGSIPAGGITQNINDFMEGMSEDDKKTYIESCNKILSGTPKGGMSFSGTYIGDQEHLKKEPILDLTRKRSQGNSFILGVPGSGRSFAVAEIRGSEYEKVMKEYEKNFK